MIILIIFTAAIVIFVSLILLRTGLRKSNRKLKEGIKLESAGRYHEALSVYDFLLKNGNSSPELRWKLANTALKVNLVSRAQKELSILIIKHFKFIKFFQRFFILPLFVQENSLVI